MSDKRALWRAVAGYGGTGPHQLLAVYKGLNHIGDLPARIAREIVDAMNGPTMVRIAGRKYRIKDTSRDVDGALVMNLDVMTDEWKPSDPVWPPVEGTSSAMNMALEDEDGLDQKEKQNG